MIEGLTRFEELRRRYHVDEAAQDVRSPIQAGEVVRTLLPVGAQALAHAVSEIERNFRLDVFASSEHSNDRSYENLSLTCNPAHAGDPHHSTLGSSKLSQGEHFYGNKETLSKVGQVRDSYYDTYGFRVVTPAATQELGFLTGRFKRSLVRSRLSIIRAGHPQPSLPFWGWHKDEPIFENLRVNIHVTDSDAHRIQIMKEDRMPMNAWDADIENHKFEVGFGYSWDTNIPHRACAIGAPAHDRAAIVYGVSPWFDYDPMTDTWVPNEFFGKKHPLQMLLDGDVL
jgi:hypothetical protein